MEPIFNQTDYQKFVLQNPNVRDIKNKAMPPPFDLNPPEKSKKAKKDIEKQKKESKESKDEDKEDQK